MDKSKLKILSFSLDKEIVSSSSRVSSRLSKLCAGIKQYDVVVPYSNNTYVEHASNFKVYGIGGVSKIEKLIKLYIKASQLFNMHKYNLVTVQDVHFVALIAYLIASRFNAAFEVQVHGFEKQWYLRRLISKLVITRADAIRTVSLRMKNDIVREFGIDENKISILPIISIPEINIERSFKIDSTHFIFLTVGRLVEIKNIHLQLTAFKKINEKFPQTQLIVVGDGKERKSLEKYAEKLRLGNNVFFTGHSLDVDTYYKMAHAFLLTSSREGWGMVVVEAASYGLPIIMTDVGLAHEFIIHNHNGIIVPINNEERLIDAMQRLVEDDELREMLGNNAKVSVTHLPNEKQIQTQYIDGFYRAINKKDKLHNN